MSFQLFKTAKDKVGNKNITFWFIRHAESEGNTEGQFCPVEHDTALTELGKEGAEKVAEYFKKEGVIITDVYSAPLLRSKDTAAVIAEQFSLPVKIHDGLHERRWGEFKDLPWNELKKKLDEMTLETRRTFVPERGESWQDMEERLFATLSEITEENDCGKNKDDMNVVIVTHRGCLRAILPLLAGISQSEHKEFSVLTASITKFSFTEDNFEFVGHKPE